MRDGAKKQLARLQGRRISECACGDDAATECRTCGEPLCRDCKLDHDCRREKLAVAQLGRAPGLEPGGRRSKSAQPDKT